MESGKYNIPNMVKGDQWSGMDLQILNGEDDTPIDITGAVIRMQLRAHPENTEIAMEFTTIDSSIVITDGVQGEFQVAPRIMSVPSRNYFYDIEVAFTGGDVKTFIAGRWHIKQDVTY